MQISIKKKKYNDDIIFLNSNIKLSNQIYILRGENGAGKTTLMNILYGTDVDFDGTVSFHERDIAHIDDYRKNIISYCTQKNIFFEFLTVKEFIRLLCPNFDTELHHNIANFFQINNLVDSENKICDLSGGEKQKIKIFISLLQDRKIILIDEPENNLDQESILKIYSYIKNLDKIIIISTHNNIYINHLSNYSVIDIADNFIKVTLNSEPILFLKCNDLKKNEYYNDIVIDPVIKKKFIDQLRVVKLSLYLGTIIFLLFFINSIINISSDIFIASNNSSDSKLSETSSLIYAPLFNEDYQYFGNSSWIEEFPSFFSDNEKNMIDNLEYVEHVEPVNLSNNGIYTTTGYYNEKFGPEFNLGNLDYKKYNLEEYSKGFNVNFTDVSALTKSKRILENVPSYYAHPHIDKIISGTFPNDNSNEIMIDIYLAMYFAEEFELEKISDLINHSIELESKDYLNTQIVERFELIDKEVKTNEYIVSGIFIPQYNAKSNEVFGILPYNENQIPAMQSNTWIDPPMDIYESQIQRSLEVANTEYTLKNLNELEKKDLVNFEKDYYQGFYIEVSSEDKLETLTKDIEKINPYIQVKNNYTISSDKIYGYMKQSILMKSILIFTLNILGFIFFRLMFTIIGKKFKSEISKLYFFDISSKSINDIRKNFTIQIFFNWIILYTLLYIYAIIKYDYLAVLIMCVFAVTFLIFFINYLFFRNFTKEEK